MKNRTLIVNADDFGQSEGINNGIIKAHEMGIVTSTSMMVRYPAAIAAAAYAKTNSSLGIGLHVDLGEWKYINEEWEQLYHVVAMDDIKAVEKEVYDQLENFYRIMQRKPTHIDSHQHVHQRALLHPIFQELAATLNVTLRGCGDEVKYCGDFYGQTYDGSPYHDAISVDALKNVIQRLPSGITELACHPGLGNDINTMYSSERAMEVESLCESSIREAVIDSGIELRSFEGITY